MNRWASTLVLALALLVLPPALLAETCATDDTGQQICLGEAAQRIVALSPGATELIWAAGAGEQVVGVVNYSDYPAAARDVQRVGGLNRVDLERLLSLEPDLVIASLSGNPAEQTERLQALGYPVYFTDPRDFDDIAANIQRLAVLAGTEEAGRAEARAFRAGIAELEARHAGSGRISVFYQIWDEPLMTVNGEHFIHQLIELCGGDNVFAELERQTPRIDSESVLARDPEVVVAGGMGEERPEWLEHWRDFSTLRAARRDNLFFVPPSLMQRPTPRLLEGGRELCGKLEIARDRR